MAGPRLVHLRLKTFRKQIYTCLVTTCYVCRPKTRVCLKRILFTRYSCIQRVRGSWRLLRYIYLLTYLIAYTALSVTKCNSHSIQCVRLTRLTVRDATRTHANL